ncbi:hypothetical protein [Peptoniphilus porci]|uniref:hypothetical protein n=1 Tax=Peptoniphilus porci TaxID=2652280 RepID=UPI001F368407|nr:hypothetical protein [Peptoniphilus porci]
MQENSISILEEEYNNLRTGMEYIAAIDCNGKFVKKRMIDLEEKNLGEDFLI